MMHGLLAQQRSGHIPLLGTDAAAVAPPYGRVRRAVLAVASLAGVAGLALPFLGFGAALVHGHEVSAVVLAAVNSTEGNETATHELLGLGLGAHIWACMPALMKALVALWVALAKCGQSDGPTDVSDEAVMYEEICSGITLAEGQRRNGRRCLSEVGWFTGALTGSATVELKERGSAPRQVAAFIERKVGLPLTRCLPARAFYKVEVRNGSTVLWREAQEPFYVLLLRFLLLHALLPVAYLRVFLGAAPHLGTVCWILGSCVALKASLYLAALLVTVIRLPVLTLFDPVSEAQMAQKLGLQPSKGRMVVTAQFLMAPEIWLVDFVTLAPQKLGLQGAPFSAVFGANAHNVLILFVALVDAMGFLMLLSLTLDGIFYGNFQSPLMSVTFWCCLSIPSGILLHSPDGKW